MQLASNSDHSVRRLTPGVRVMAQQLEQELMCWAGPRHLFEGRRHEDLAGLRAQAEQLRDHLQQRGFAAQAAVADALVERLPERDDIDEDEWTDIYELSWNLTELELRSPSRKAT